jgi:hypothetical protein
MRKRKYLFYFTFLRARKQCSPNHNSIQVSSVSSAPTKWSCYAPTNSSNNNDDDNNRAVVVCLFCFTYVGALGGYYINRTVKTYRERVDTHRTPHRSNFSTGDKNVTTRRLSCCVNRYTSITSGGWIRVRDPKIIPIVQQ